MSHLANTAVASDRPHHVSLKISIFAMGFHLPIDVVNQLLYGTIDLPYDPTDNGENPKNMQVDGTLVYLDLCRYLGDDENIILGPHMDQYTCASDAFLLVYDMGKPDTFEYVKRIYHEILVPACQQTKPIWICSAGSPGLSWEPFVSVQEGEELSKAIGVPFRTVTLVTGEGLGEDFLEQMVRTALQNRDRIDRGEGVAQEPQQKSGQDVSCLPFYRIQKKLRNIWRNKAS